MTTIAPESIDPLNLPSLPLESRKDLPNCQGIYFVISSQGLIQYIGRTNNLKKRWQKHHRLSQLEKYLDVKIAWLEVSDCSLLPLIEKALIEWFKPYLNQTAVEGTKTTVNRRSFASSNPNLVRKYRRVEKEKHALGQHPNSKANLIYHEGRPQAFGTKKLKRNLTVTEEGWERLQMVIKEVGCSSVSEFLEKLGRGQLKVSA